MCLREMTCQVTVSRRFFVKKRLLHHPPGQRLHGVADLAIVLRQVHCVLAYFFNTTLVALTINIASGLF